MSKAKDLKTLRTWARLRQNDLAERSGVSITTISNIEAGVRTNPSFQTVEALAEVIVAELGGSVDDVIVSIFRGAVAAAEKR